MLINLGLGFCLEISIVGLRLGLPLKCFSRNSRGFAGLVRVPLVSPLTTLFIFYLGFLSVFEL
jgi:hypothetical protein